MTWPSYSAHNQQLSYSEGAYNWHAVSSAEGVTFSWLEMKHFQGRRGDGSRIFWPGNDHVNEHMKTPLGEEMSLRVRRLIRMDFVVSVGAFMWTHLCARQM